MGTIKMKIDGKSVECEEGTTILEAAKAADHEIKIPTLCYNEKLKPQGVCRLCMVEITKGNRKKLVASCVYPAEEGLIVETNTEEIRKIRRMLIELVWPSAQDLGREYGIEKSRFKPLHTDCSLCGLCVRYCTEIKRNNALYFKGRGINRKVAFFPPHTDECAYCEECFHLCTGGWIVNEMVKVLT